jgi:DNA-binding HxlR family transcriptional regulator
MAKSNALPNQPPARRDGAAGAAPITGSGGPRNAAEGTTNSTPGPSPQIPNLDRLIHERIRLGIVSALAAAKNPLTFNDLKSLLQTTDGNLSVHARKLEEAKYIACTKSFEGRVPRTEYSLTLPGRRAFEKYLDHMEAIIQAAKR